MTKSCRVALLAGLVLAAASRSHAAPVVYNVDPLSSFLQIGVGVAGAPPTIITVPQSPGSDMTSLFGVVNADLTGSSIEITSASVGLDLQPVDPSPGPFGAPGTAPGQIGLLVSAAPIVTGPAAVRNAQVAATSGPLALLGGAFDATGVAFSLSSGVVDVSLSGLLNLQDQLDVAGFGSNNELSGGTLSTAGAIETLTIPVLVTVPIDDPSIPVPLVAVFQGDIVATRLIPEPASLVLAGFGLLGLGLMARRLRAV